MNSKCYSTSSSLPLPSAYRDHRTAYEPGISGTSLHRSVCISTESAQESLTAAAGPAISAQILAVSRSDKRLAAPTAIPRSSSHGLDIRTRGYKRVLSSLVDAHPRQVAFVGSGTASAFIRLAGQICPVLLHLHTFVSNWRFVHLLNSPAIVLSQTGRNHKELTTMTNFWQVLGRLQLQDWWHVM